jgi:hypothetical protein
MANDRRPLFANKPLMVQVRTGLAGSHPDLELAADFRQAVPVEAKCDP